MGTTNRDNNTDEHILIPLLVARSCHLPGNDWKADWIQWFRNNHILFGICLHHRLHPVEWWERCLALIGSISFGLIATNLVYQWDLQNPQDLEELYFSILGYDLTKGMIWLWTIGGLGHSIFDMTVWHIMACACCHPGGKWGNNSGSERYRDCASYLLVPVVLAMLGVAVWLVLWRASGSKNLSDVEEINKNSLSFLAQYAVELALAWFVYFFLVGTILFSGIFGCGGRLPILGGRPRDVKRVEDGRLGLSSQGSAYSFF